MKWVYTINALILLVTTFLAFNQLPNWFASIMMALGIFNMLGALILNMKDMQ